MPWKGQKYYKLNLHFWANFLQFLQKCKCPAKLPGNPAWQPCLAILPGKPAKQPCLATLPGNSAWQPCLCKSAWQPCLENMTGKPAWQIWLATLSGKTGLATLLSWPELKWGREGHKRTRMHTVRNSASF